VLAGRRAARGMMKKVATPVDASGAASVFSLPIALRLSTFLLLALALILGAGAGASFAAGEGDEEDITTAVPRAVVERTVTDVIAALEIPELKSEQRLERIEELVFNVFDFRTMGKLVLARNWKKFDPDQRRRFIIEFKQYLSRNYGNRLERYRKTRVDVVGARVEKRGDVTVLSKVVGSDYDGVEMNYRLRFRSGKWKMIDIIVEGVSLLANFRSQFGEIVNRHGPEGLLERMQQKNIGPDSEATEDSAATAPAA